MTPAAVLSILVKAQGVSTAARDLKSVDTAGRKASKSFSMVGTAAKASAAFLGAAGFAKALGAVNSEYREAQKTGAQTNAVLKSTGDAAKVTQKHVENLANAISRKVGIDDEEIQASENMLLTFTKVRNEAGKGNKIFDQATRVVTDMSVALGQSGKNSAIQLGKALNDPIKGVTALRRVGVSFDAQQQKQIKTLATSGNMLGAQKLILRELNKEFGGSAAAQATAGDKLKVALGNLAEAAGTVLVPALDKVATFTTKLINQFIAGKGTGGQIRDALLSVASAAARAVGWIKQLVEGFQQGKVWAVALVVALAGLSAAVVVIKAVTAATKAWAAAQVLLDVAMDANPIMLAVAAIVGLGVAIVIAYKKIKPFRDAVNATWGAIKSGVSSAINFVKDHWLLLVGILTGPFGLAVVAIVKHFGDIRRAAGKLPGQIVDAIKATPGLLLGAGKWMISQLVSGIKGTFDLIKDAANWLKDKVVDTIKGIFGIHSPSTVFEGLGNQMIHGLIRGLKPSNIASMIKSAVGGVAHLAGSVLGLGGSGPDQSVTNAGTAGGSTRQWLMQALRITGQYTPANYAALYRQMMSESGGNPRAINLWDSNAKAGHPSKGLLQTIDSTFQSYRLPSLPNDIYNPVSNAVAAIRYMIARYGHIVGTGHGYAKGTNSAAKGLAVVGEKGPELVNFRGGEQVFAHGQAVRGARHAAAVRGARGAGASPYNPLGLTGMAYLIWRRNLAKGYTEGQRPAVVDSGSGEDPNQPLIDAQNDAKEAADRLREELAGVRDELAKQTAFATSVQATSNFQLTKSLADLVSGRIVGYGVVGRSFTPGTGVEVAY